MLWNPNSVTSESSDSVYASPKRSNLLCGGIKNLGSNRVAAARGIQFDHIFRNQLFSFEVNVRLLNKSLNRYDMSTNLDIRKSMTSGNGGSTTSRKKGGTVNLRNVPSMNDNNWNCGTYESNMAALNVFRVRCLSTLSPG